MDWSSDVCSSDLWWGPEGRPGSISGDWANDVPASFGSRARGVRVDIAMHAFAALLDSLVYTRSRNAKLRLIGDYLRSTPDPDRGRSEEHTSELQSLMRISYAVFCLKKKKQNQGNYQDTHSNI